MTACFPVTVDHCLKTKRLITKKFAMTNLALRATQLTIIETTGTGNELWIHKGELSKAKLNSLETTSFG